MVGEQDLRERINAVMRGGVDRIALGSPVPGAPHGKTTVRRSGDGFLWERRSDSQAFHETMGAEKTAEALAGEMTRHYRQMHIWGHGYEYGFRITKNGRLLYNRRPCEHPPAVQEFHDRKKNYLIEEGIAVPPLADMGVLTPDGRVVKGMAAKFRQINRAQERGPLRVLDLGCGKSYLTFVLYHYLVNIKKLEADVTGLDLKADVVGKCNAAAARYGYGGLRFETGRIQDYDKRADMVVSLHACDTATDYALN
jgi:hypothetical protein